MSHSSDDIDRNSANTAESTAGYANYSYGVVDTRKLKRVGDSLLRLKEHDPLLFEFIDRLASTTPVASTQLQQVMVRVQKQMIKQKEAFHNHVLAHLQDSTQPLAFSEQQYLTLVRQQAAATQQRPDEIVTADSETLAIELKRSFQFIVDYLTKDNSTALLQYVLKRASPAWKKASGEAAEPVRADTDQAVLTTKFLCYLRNRSLAIPFTQFAVCVDPHWDDKLQAVATTTRRDVLQRLICLLAREFSREMAAVYLARVTQSAHAYKVWLVNVALNESLVTARFKPEDMASVNLAELVQHDNTATLPGIDARRMNRIQASVNHIAVLAETEAIETAKLEMGMNIDSDPVIAKAKQEAALRREEIEVELRRLAEKLKACWGTASPAVSERVKAAAGYPALAHDLETLKLQLQSLLTQQAAEVAASQKQLETETRKLANAYQEDVNNIDKMAANSLANPLLLAIDTYLDALTTPNQEAVFKELLQMLDVPEQPSRTEFAVYVYRNSQTEQLLEKINYILQNSKHLVLKDMLERLLDDLQKNLPAFEFSRTKKIISYNPERFADQQRHHYTRILDDYKNDLLRKIEQVGFHGDWLDSYRSKVHQLAKCFENEKANHDLLMPVYHDVEQYRSAMHLALDDILRPLVVLNAEYDAAVKLFPAVSDGNQEDQSLQRIRQAVDGKIHDIEQGLKRMENMANGLLSPRNGLNGVRVPEDRIHKNKELIKAAYDDLKRLRDEFVDFCNPCIRQKVAYDGLLKNTYEQLKSLLLNAEFLQQCVTPGLRTGGEKVRVGEVDYKVHSHIAALVLTVQQLEQDKSLSVESKVAGIIKAYHAAANAAPPAGLFSRREEKPVPGSAVGDLCVPVSKLIQCADLTGAEQSKLLQGVFQQLAGVAQKYVPQQAPRHSHRFMAPVAARPAEPPQVELPARKSAKKTASGRRSR